MLPGVVYGIPAFFINGKILIKRMKLQSEQSRVQYFLHLANRILIHGMNGSERKNVFALYLFRPREYRVELSRLRRDRRDDACVDVSFFHRAKKVANRSVGMRPDVSANRRDRSNRSWRQGIRERVGMKIKVFHDAAILTEKNFAVNADTN